MCVCVCGAAQHHTDGNLRRFAPQSSSRMTKQPTTNASFLGYPATLCLLVLTVVSKFAVDNSRCRENLWLMRARANSPRPALFWLASASVVLLLFVSVCVLCVR